MAATTLLVCDDPDLVELVRRAAAAAGRALDVLAGPPGRSAWLAASRVLVSSELAPACVDAALPRRAGVAVVTADPDDALPWRALVLLGADEVLRLPDDDASLLPLLGDGSADGPRAPVIGVCAGSGGAGASVLAASLAIAAARAGRSPLLVDTDHRGAGLDLLLAAEDAPGARWPDLAEAGAGLAPDTLRAALPVAEGVAVLSVGRQHPGPVPLAAADAVLPVARSAFDLVVVDLPAGGHGVQLASRCDSALLVATGDVRGAACASRRARALAHSVELRLVARALPGAGLDGEQLGDWLGLEVAAELPHDPRLVAALDRGDPPARPRSPLASVSDRLVDRLLAR